MNKDKKKYLDNINNKLRYYRNKYNYDLTKKQYKEFVNNINIIKKIYKYHDFICNIPKHKIPYHLVDFYGKNYNILNQGYSIKNFLLKLKKIENNDLNQKSENNDLNQKSENNDLNQKSENNDLNQKSENNNLIIISF